MKNNSTTRPLFFVFTCVKDGRQYIKKLFDSLLAQTKVNFVHYIYDDGSKESLDDLIKEYKYKSSQLEHPFQIIYERNPTNIGLALSTKHCIEKCFCDYFIWVDCDNYVDSHFFEELENTYKKNKRAEIIRTMIKDSESKKELSFNIGDRLNLLNSKNQLSLFLRSMFYYSFFAVKKKFYTKANPNNILLNEKSFFVDDQVLLICFLSAKKVVISKKAIGYFYIRNGSESNNSPAVETQKAFHVTLMKLISQKLGRKIEGYYLIKEIYLQIQEKYSEDPKTAYKLLKKIKSIEKSMKSKFSLHYEGSYLKWKMKILKKYLKL